jgi:hypothetical protein
MILATLESNFHIYREPITCDSLVKLEHNMSCYQSFLHLYSYIYISTGLLQTYSEIEQSGVLEQARLILDLVCHVESPFQCTNEYSIRLVAITLLHVSTLYSYDCVGIVVRYAWMHVNLLSKYFKTQNNSQIC